MESALDAFLQALDDTYSSDRLSLTSFGAIRQRVETFLVDRNRIPELVRAKLDEKALSLQRLQNQRCPLHQLPVELLSDILYQSMDRTDADHVMNQYHVLAQVCKLWFDIIVNASRFWHHVDVDHFDRVDMILKHHRSGPLSFWSYGSRVEEFMAKVRPKAAFWDFFSLDCYLSDDIKNALEEPHPDLMAMFVRIKRHSSSETQRIALSDGTPLTTVDLTGLALHWDSQRLVGINRLQLVKLDSHLPTVKQLHTILVASPSLTILSLVDWVDFRNAAWGEGDDPRDIDSPIALPSLKKLDLRKIPAAYKTHLFDHIDCPSVESFFTDAVISRRPLTAAEVPPCHIACALLKTTKKIQATYGTGGKTCRLQSIPFVTPLSDTWSDKKNKNDPVGFDYTFDLGDADMTWWAGFGAFLLEHTRDAGSVALMLDATESGIRNLEGDLIAPPPLPLNILGDSLHFITHLVVGKYYNSRNVLNFLTTTLATESGPSRWPCPKLEVFDISDAMSAYLLTDEVIQLVEARNQASSGSDGEPPRSLKTVVVPTNMVDLFTWVESLRPVSFSDSWSDGD